MHVNSFETERNLFNSFLTKRRDMIFKLCDNITQNMSDNDYWFDNHFGKERHFNSLILVAVTILS